MRDRVISGIACRLIMLAFSISLFGVTGCASSQLTPEEQGASSVTPGLVRLSVGLENIEDILDDLRAGFAASS